MDIIAELKKEFDRETDITKKFIALVPYDKLTWKPHPKSMDFSALAGHIAELPGWMDFAINSNEVNFATMDYAPPVINAQGDLDNLLTANIGKGKNALAKADVNSMDDQWQLKNGDVVLMDLTRYEMIRHAFDQIIHHRAQLGVYLRLNDIPLPGSYGPSADSESH
ncbi:MAG: DinB family protein [Ginsengibacter sp.]